jgi:hypothetical protein
METTGTVIAIRQDYEPSIAAARRELRLKYAEVERLMQTEQKTLEAYQALHTLRHEIQDLEEALDGVSLAS